MNVQAGRAIELDSAAKIDVSGKSPIKTTDRESGYPGNTGTVCLVTLYIYIISYKIQ